MSKIASFLAAVVVFGALFAPPVFAGVVNIIKNTDVKDCHVDAINTVPCDDVRAVVEVCVIDAPYNMYCSVPGTKITYRGEYLCDFGRGDYFVGCLESAKAEMMDIYELAQSDLPAAKAALAKFWPKAVKFVGKRFKEDYLETRRVHFVKSMSVLRQHINGAEDNAKAMEGVLGRIAIQYAN